LSANETELQQPEMITPVEPSWLKRLVTIIGMEVVVETTRKELYGKLLAVEHDHIVLQIKYGIAFVRCQQIISVMPLCRC
jgi:hypothetical protein